MINSVYIVGFVVANDCDCDCCCWFGGNCWVGRSAVVVLVLVELEAVMLVVDDGGFWYCCCAEGNGEF